MKIKPLEFVQTRRDTEVYIGTGDKRVGVVTKAGDGLFLGLFEAGGLDHLDHSEASTEEEARAGMVQKYEAFVQSFLEAPTYGVSFIASPA